MQINLISLHWCQKILRAQAGQTKCPWSSCRVTRTLSLSKIHAYKVANFDINYGNAFFFWSLKRRRVESYFVRKISS